MFKVTESIVAKCFQRKKLAAIAKSTDTTADVDGQMYPSRGCHDEFLALDGVVADWASAAISSLVNLFFKRAPFLGDDTGSSLRSQLARLLPREAIGDAIEQSASVHVTGPGGVNSVDGNTFNRN